MGAIKYLEWLADLDVAPNVDKALTQVLSARQQRREKRRKQFALSSLSLLLATAIVARPPVRSAVRDLYAEVTVRAFGITPPFSANWPEELLLPNVFPLAPATPRRPVSLGEAQSFVRFRIQWPHTELLPYQPQFFVHDATTLTRRIDAVPIETALKRLGRDPVAVPGRLAGATIAVTFQKSLTISLGTCPELVGPWQACAFLTEAVAPKLTLPQGVGLNTLTLFSLQLLGLGAADAKALSRTGELFFPPENYASHKIVRVNGQDALLVIYKPGPTAEVAYNLSWTVQGIAYSLFGRNPSTALLVAESLR